MKKFYAVLFMCGSFLGASAQQTDQSAMMKKWQDYMTPGAMQKILAKSEGAWITKNTIWMDPSTPPTEAKGNCVTKMIMGGRYQQTNFKGEVMGMPFEGQSLTAFDNAKQVFINTWIDNMGTGILVLEGKWDAANQTIIYVGKMVDPMTGKDTQVKEVLTLKDASHQTLVMYGLSPEGKEYKSMELSLTKAGK